MLSIPYTRREFNKIGLQNCDNVIQNFSQESITHSYLCNNIVVPHTDHHFRNIYNMDMFLGLHTQDHEILNKYKSIFRLNELKYEMYFKTLVSPNRSNEMILNVDVLKMLETREKALAAEYYGMILTHLFAKEQLQAKLVMPLSALQSSFYNVRPYEYLRDNINDVVYHKPDFICFSHDNSGIHYHSLEAKGTITQRFSGPLAEGLIQANAISLINNFAPATKSAGVAYIFERKLKFYWEDPSEDGTIEIDEYEFYSKLGFYLTNMMLNGLYYGNEDFFLKPQERKVLDLDYYFFGSDSKKTSFIGGFELGIEKKLFEIILNQYNEYITLYRLGLIYFEYLTESNRRLKFTDSPMLFGDGFTVNVFNK